MCSCSQPPPKKFQVYDGPCGRLSVSCSSGALLPITPSPVLGQDIGDASKHDCNTRIEDGGIVPEISAGSPESTRAPLGGLAGWLEN